MTIQELLKSKRKGHKLSLEQVGEALQLRASTISKYEKGIVKNIPLFRLLSIIDFLNITLKEFTSTNYYELEPISYINICEFLEKKESSNISQGFHKAYLTVETKQELIESLKAKAEKVNHVIPCIFISSTDYTKEEYQSILKYIDFINYLHNKKEE